MQRHATLLQPLLLCYSNSFILILLLTLTKVIGSPQSLRNHYENEISKLHAQHHDELSRLREEHEDHTRIVRESVEEEFDQKLVAVLHDAKQVWEEEQEEDRYKNPTYPPLPWSVVFNESFFFPQDSSGRPA